MKILGGQIYEAKPALDRLLDLQLSLKKAYELTKFVKRLHEEFTFIEQKRNDIVLKNCEPSKENDGMFTVKEKNKEEFQKEMAELLSLEIELEGFEKINLSEVNLDGSDVKFSVKEILVLEPFVEF